MHRRDKKHSSVPSEGRIAGEENGPSLTACIKPSRTIRSAVASPTISDGRLPSIIVIYSQYHEGRADTATMLSDATGCIERILPRLEKARRGTEKSKIKLGRMYRRVLEDVAHAAKPSVPAKLESFLRESHVAVGTFRSPWSADYTTSASEINACFSYYL